MTDLFLFRDELVAEHPDMEIKYFVDYGKFGANDGHYRDVVIQWIERDGLVPLHYDPVKFGGLEDAGFVALVEKGAAAKGKILVAVGGGNCQADMAYRMKSEPKSERIYRLCTNQAGEQQSEDIKH